MKVYNITHGVDIDGMSSAAMLVHYHNLPLENILFINYDEARFSNAVREIRKLKSRGNLFILSDFGTNDALVDRVVGLFSELRKNGNRIVWLDHHPWDRKASSKIPKYCDFVVAGENKFRCGAELVYRLLCKKDAFGEKLARFAHVADFALDPDSRAQGLLLKKYTFVITYFNLHDFKWCDANLRKLVAHLSRGEFDNALIERAYADYQKILRSSLKKLAKSSRVINAGRYRIAIGFSEGLNSTTACMELTKRFRTEIALNVNTSARKTSGNLRSIKGVDCSRLAKALGGGGHPQASGFRIEKNYDFGTEPGRVKFTGMIAKLSGRLYK